MDIEIMKYLVLENGGASYNTFERCFRIIDGIIF